MALGKYYEDIVEARSENGAAVIFDYQHPQEKLKRVAHHEMPLEPARHRLTLLSRAALRVFVIKLESDPSHVSPQLLQQTYDWTAAHFKSSGKIARELSAPSDGASGPLN